MQSSLIPRSFRVTNYRNIDDSGWIPLERVTAFVGRNESGKTALLKALHKFNPARNEPYEPQKEFPRDRFAREYMEGTMGPVCSLQFELTADFQKKLQSLCETEIPQHLVCTRFYDGSLHIFKAQVHSSSTAASSEHDWDRIHEFEVEKAVLQAMPVFIYFENYGILDSAVYLPRFLEDLQQSPDDPKLRTINAMFKYAGLEASDILKLGRAEADQALRDGREVTEAVIRRDREQKELRAVKMNAASLEITRRFGQWFHQRQHSIRYQADGDYFRVWVTDDRRPGVEIELESRGKGFQWFFSFYLLFCVESEEGHKDAVLLLDEPGLHLHPSAQKDLVVFFEDLAAKNRIIYTTHSPFLIDGKHIQRVRPVSEDASGHSHISVQGWPKDPETLFPLQAAAGYAMFERLFRDQKSLLVGDLSDVFYLQTLSHLCRATKRTSLSGEIAVVPCGGFQHIGYLSSLLLSKGIRPVILLHGEDAEWVRSNRLIQELLAWNRDGLILLDDVLSLPQCGTEDILGEEVLVPILEKLIRKNIVLNSDDRNQGRLITQMASAVQRIGASLPNGWKEELARQLAAKWSTTRTELIPFKVLDRAEKLFASINQRFDQGEMQDDKGAGNNAV